MQTMLNKPFNVLVEYYLGDRLPEKLINEISISRMSAEGQNFILRMLSLMKRSGYRANEFTLPFLQWLKTISNMLPSAWGGIIPPITVPDRHKKFDDYVIENFQQVSARKNSRIFVDLGCGFPPVTTSETAIKLSDWNVFGVDYSFAEYVLYDADGNYACFDKNGVFQYCQESINNRGHSLYVDLEKTKNRFNTLFSNLFPLISPSIDNSKSQIFEKDGNKLIHGYIRDFEKNNLSFIETDIRELKIEFAQVVRCMNVLLYFEPKVKNKMLTQINDILDDNGIVIAGTNGIGIQSRYFIYRKIAGRTIPVEFAFSPDNLSPLTFMPWFTIHEHDSEAILLSELTGTIRADKLFWKDFSSRIDTLLKDHDICQRGSDGFLHFLTSEMVPGDYAQRTYKLWQQVDKEGYIDSVLNILNLAGYNSWKNPVGDIAVHPPASCFNSAY